MAAGAFHCLALRGSASLLLLCSAGCIASNVVAPDERMVVEPLAERVFEPAPTRQLEGLFESCDIQGDAAVSLRKIYYLFSLDGTYTAAALAEVAGKFSFQTLDGIWQNDAAMEGSRCLISMFRRYSGKAVRISSSVGTTTP